MFETIADVDVTTNALIDVLQAFVKVNAPRLNHCGYVRFELREYCERRGLRHSPIPEIAVLKLSAIGILAKQSWPHLIVFRDAEGAEQLKREEHAEFESNALWR